MLRKNFKVKSTPKTTSLEKVAVPKVTLASAIVYNCCSKIYAILYAWITAITAVSLSNEQKVTVPKVTPASQNVCNCSSKRFTILNPWTPPYVLRFLKKWRYYHYAGLPWKNVISVSAFVHLTQYFSRKVLQLVLWNK